VERRDIEDIYELSPIQQGLLYELVKAPKSGVYVEQMTIDLAGRLDQSAFVDAWQRFVARHTILRTSFHWAESGRPLQVVHRQATLQSETLEWESDTDDEFQARYDAWLFADRMTPFDLGRPPLMRVTLIRRSQDRWRFAWRFSHLVMDGWSFGVAIIDWLSLYRAELHGTAPEAAPVRPYRDYVAWWREHPPSDVDRCYWEQELADYLAPEPLSQGGLRSLPAGEATHAFVDFQLGSLVRQVQGAGGALRVTANTVVQGAWSILLGRYGATADVLTGATAAHRPRELIDAETILGPMIATIPLRARIDPDRGVLDWLQELQLRHARGRQHATFPLPEMQRFKTIAGNLLETTLSNQNVPLPKIALADLDLELTDYTYDGRPHFALSLIVLPGDDMPTRLVYDRQRFGHGFATRLTEQLRELIGEVAADPGARIGELSALTEAERVAFAGQAVRRLPAPTGETVIDMFDARTREAPQSTAVSFAEERLSYSELAERSVRLAARLARDGVGPGDRVGLCLERSPGLIVAILAILRAGAAYVPMSPEHPASRLRYLIEDSEVGAMVTRRDYLGHLPNLNDGGIAAICLDRDLSGDADAHVVQVDDQGGNGYRPDAHSVMYVLYTSGSTGRPKGVPITHGDVQQFLGATFEHLVVSEQDAWSMYHDCGFDVSVLEMWGALTTGGRLVLMSSETAHSADAMLELIQRERVTVLNQTPSAFELLALADECSPVDRCATLRWVIFIGERLDPARLRHWVVRRGDEQPKLVNMFGITETTVASTWRRVTADDVLGANGSPIGMPLSHQRMYLLDDKGRPTPSGVRGELYIAGRSIAKGYLNRPELTAERFGEDPFSPGAETMYRTGDIARRHGDGSFEYIGRSDEQVQVGGVRVEPAEVEAYLLELPGVRQAAVLARPGPRGETRLVAYLAGEASPGALREHLPIFMVPSVVVELKSLPLSRSGKVDRRALPEPPVPADIDRERVAPRTRAEADMAQLVGEVLECTELGVLDDLITLGMHSLDAMRIVVRIRRSWDVELPLKALYAKATVAGLAEAVQKLQTEGGRASCTAATVRS
jgi:surfactin family lipopeptide synthetase C